MHRKRYIILAIVVFAALMLVAFHRRMPVDDAFISFRYAQNLAAGHGPIWNIGERVEGYSNFLWVIIAAAGIKLGVQPENFTLLVSIPLHLGCLILIYIIGLRLLPTDGWALTLVSLVGLNSSVAGFAVSGMETPLVMLLFLAAMYFIIRGFEGGWSAANLLMLALILNVALLTRPDSIVLVGLAVFAIGGSWGSDSLKHRLIFIVPFLLILLPYLGWKYRFYGSVIPNTFHVRVRGISGVAFGLLYIYLFTLTGFLLPYWAIVVAKWKSLRRGSRVIMYMAVLCLAWVIYVILAGGDFMEFRFMTPVLPFIFLIIMHVLISSIADQRAVIALVAGLFLGNINGLFALEKSIRGYGVESLHGLRMHLIGPGQDWIRIGKRLGEVFGGTDVVISCGAAGTIPYYSGLTTIDVMGLNDRTIPKIAEPFSFVAGHRIISPVEYLIDRRVNLVVEPINNMMRNDRFRAFQRYADWGALYNFYLNVDAPVHGRTITDAVLLAIPIDENYTLVTWYMTPSAVVERIADELGCQRIRLTRGGGNW